ncbi:hypothetical protein OG696_35660 [Streptomyces sp. NBC_00656]|uniref:hypothetical protein n=1 Tax=Streptomyces sp. NBC_00656 TaxID=2903668 RepID=UPI003249FEF2
MDRLGRNVIDCLNTGYKMRDEKKMLVTHGHDTGSVAPETSQSSAQPMMCAPTDAAGVRTFAR